MLIHPIRLSGNWVEGYALDDHTIRSTFIGHDEFGHAVFRTERSEVGELLYRLKYRDDRRAVRPLGEALVAFILDWGIAPDWIIPVPPSRSRRFQPVLALADQIGQRLKIPVWEQGITKVRRTSELKDVYNYAERIRLLRGAYTIQAGSLDGEAVLLFDDLYRSGATLHALTNLLYQQGAAAAVYALTISRTRSNR